MIEWDDNRKVHGGVAEWSIDHDFQTGFCSTGSTVSCPVAQHNTEEWQSGRLHLS
jgi:hypothetical protein